MIIFRRQVNFWYFWWQRTTTTTIIIIIITRKLSDRTDDRAMHHAPYIWMPGKFSRVPEYATDITNCLKPMFVSVLLTAAVAIFS